MRRARATVTQCVTLQSPCALSWKARVGETHPVLVDPTGERVLAAVLDADEIVRAEGWDRGAAAGGQPPHTPG